MSKICSDCHTEKALCEFNKNKQSKDGLHIYCKTCRSIRRRNYYLKNKTKELERNMQYRSTRKEQYIAYAVKVNRKQRETKPEAKLRHNIRNRIKRAFKGNYQSGSAIQLIGCSVEEVKKYLESQFLPGMSWENYGEWHIDHIIPLSAFNLSNEEEAKKACNYKNLQPLWAKDNLEKSNKIF